MYLACTLLKKINTNNKINKNKHVYKTKLAKYNCEMHSFSQQALILAKIQEQHYIYPPHQINNNNKARKEKKKNIKTGFFFFLNFFLYPAPSLSLSLSLQY